MKKEILLLPNRKIVKSQSVKIFIKSFGVFFIKKE